MPKHLFISMLMWLYDYFVFIALYIKTYDYSQPETRNSRIGNSVSLTCKYSEKEEMWLDGEGKICF